MDKLTLALDPRLGLTADEIVAGWNADPTLREKAEAKRGQATPGTFDPTLAQTLVTLAVSVAGSITSGLVLELIKARLKAKGKEETPVEIEQRELPTGERILITRVGRAGS